MHDDDAEDELTALRSLGRGLQADEPWESPPADLWARIASAAGVDPGGATGDPDADSEPPPAISSAPTGRSESPADISGTREGPADVVRLDDRRGARPGGRPMWLVAACVLAVIVGVAVIASVVGSGDDDPTSVLASSDLEALGERGQGRAELVDHAGNLELRVELADLDPGDGFLEVWMIDPTVTGLVSLGPVRSDGTYVLPPGFDPADFPIVDVSVEPIDGDPTHSGASVLRGQLEI